MIDAWKKEKLMTTQMILRDKFTSRSKMAATDPQLRKVEIIDNGTPSMSSFFVS